MAKYAQITALGTEIIAHIAGLCMKVTAFVLTRLNGNLDTATTSTHKEVRVLLKKDWRSKKGKLYPAGTVFIKSMKLIHIDPSMTWWDFMLPSGEYGCTLLPTNLGFVLKDSCTC